MVYKAFEMSNGITYIGRENLGSLYDIVTINTLPQVSVKKKRKQKKDIKNIVDVYIDAYREARSDLSLKLGYIHNISRRNGHIIHVWYLGMDILGEEKK